MMHWSHLSSTRLSSKYTHRVMWEEKNNSHAHKLLYWLWELTGHRPFRQILFVISLHITFVDFISIDIFSHWLNKSNWQMQL